MPSAKKKPAVRLTTMKLTDADREVIDQLSKILGVGMADAIRIATREALSRRLRDEYVEELAATIDKLKRRKGAA